MRDSLRIIVLKVLVDGYIVMEIAILVTLVMDGVKVMVLQIMHVDR